MLKGFQKDGTAKVAKERLRSILISDRLHCSNDEIRELETEVYRCVSKYFSVSPSKINTRMIQKKESSDGKKEFVLIFETTIQE